MLVFLLALTLDKLIYSVRDASSVRVRLLLFASLHSAVFHLPQSPFPVGDSYGLYKYTASPTLCLTVSLRCPTSPRTCEDSQKPDQHPKGHAEACQVSSWGLRPGPKCPSARGATDALWESKSSFCQGPQPPACVWRMPAARCCWGMGPKIRPCRVCVIWNVGTVLYRKNVHLPRHFKCYLYSVDLKQREKNYY